MSIDYDVKSDEELSRLSKLIRKSGYYPYLTTQDEVIALQNDKEKLDDVFKRCAVETMVRWLKLADERLKGTNIKCFVCPGNDDIPEIDPLFSESSTVVNAQDEVVSVDEHHEMINVGWVNPSPWKTHREWSEEELSRKIEEQVAQMKNVGNSIFQLHAPPYGTGLAEAPKLDQTMKRVYGDVSDVGSTAVRSAIEKYQPLIALHGHIHEVSGMMKIGRTQCYNPGSSYEQGTLLGYLIDLDADKVKNYTRISG